MLVSSEPEVRRIIGDAFDRMTVRQGNTSESQNLSMWYELNKYNKNASVSISDRINKKIWEYRRFQLENTGVTSEGLTKC